MRLVDLDINSSDSWKATWAALDIDEFIRLLEGHVGRNILDSRTRLLEDIRYELKWSGGWGTGTVDWLSASERGQYLDGCPAMNTKCLVPLPFLPDLIPWSTENRSHGSPVLVPPETQ